MRFYVLIAVNITFTVLCNVADWFGGWVQTFGATCWFPLDGAGVFYPRDGDSRFLQNVSGITSQKTVVLIFDKL
jgi:hypothetical protein